MHRTVFTGAAVLLAVLVPGCVGGGGIGKTGYVTGTVTFLQSMELPPDARVIVELRDVSIMDAPALVIAADTIVTGGAQVPIAFKVPYERKRIDPARTYSIHAEIHIGGERRFITTQSYPVLTRGEPANVDVVVMAIEKPSGVPMLEGTYWKLVQVEGGDVIHAHDARREPHLTLIPEERRAIATGGCNQMVGGYEATEASLSFSPFASTRMMCPDVMEQEDALGRALAATRGYRVEGAVLELLDEQGGVLARFEAAPHDDE